MKEKISHEGIIFKVDNGKAWVTIVQKSACADCHAKSMCQISEQKEKNIEIAGVDDSFNAGDKVSVIGATSLGLWAVFYAFVIPLVLIVLTLIFSLSYFQSESIAALFSMGILIVYFLILYIFQDKLKKKFVFTIKKEI